MENSKKTEFTVTLDGIQLPDNLYAEIKNELQQVFMKKVASIDWSKVPGHGQDAPIKPVKGGHSEYVIISRPIYNGYVARLIDEKSLQKAIDSKNVDVLQNTFSPLKKN